VRKNDNIPKAIVGLPILGGKKFIPEVSNITIEISGRCNAKCPYCIRQRFKQRYSGIIMSRALFENILNHLFDIGLLPRDYTSAINLYNWGEPFLNPELNDILEVLKKKKLRAAISSNFIVKPELDKDNLSVISIIILSLSGFTQNSYGKIHGASLKRVLDNFEDLYQKIRNYSPNTRILIAWHRYRFNESELWEAYKYFDRPGIHFHPTVAALNDLPEMLSYAEGVLPEDRRKQAEDDLFLDYISQGLAYHRQRSKQYHCFDWKSLVIDETGQLLLCCGMSNEDTDHVLGNVIEMSAEEIWQKKLSDPICKTCISSGGPRMYVSGMYYKKPLPSGEKGSYFKLRYQLCLFGVIDRGTRIIRLLPGGEQIICMLRKMRDTVSN
jgi:MoaA/NifB/PqqE/SkfB family radical SAM enzyme